MSGAINFYDSQIWKTLTLQEYWNALYFRTEGVDLKNVSIHAKSRARTRVDRLSQLSRVSNSTSFDTLLPETCKHYAMKGLTGSIKHRHWYLYAITVKEELFVWSKANPSAKFQYTITKSDISSKGFWNYGWNGAS